MFGAEQVASGGFRAFMLTTAACCGLETDVNQISAVKPKQTKRKLSR